MEELLCDCKGVKFYNNCIEHNGKIYPFVDNSDHTARLTEKEQQDALIAAKEAIKVRMHHCISHLLENLETASTRNEYEVSWENGHFSAPVYNIMESFLTIKSWKEADIPQCQQVLRALYENAGNLGLKEQDLYNAFQIASELIICISWDKFVESH